MGVTSWDLIYNCIQRSNTYQGSSKDWSKMMTTAGMGILDSSDPNNKFKDWNVAFIMYCDGGLHQG